MTTQEIKTDLNLKTWLEYIESTHPKKMDFSLKRNQTVAERLNLLRPNLWSSLPFVITIAGTNGKGSCVRLLESILSAAGYKVGAYTSPHLLRYNERIRVNQQEASDETLCQALAEINSARADIPLTYFEFTTIAALRIFQQSQLDIVILEVGLGGRLDTVNIVDPDISVITSIALDHTEYLGNDREAIAREKAGIMRSNKPIVCGDINPPANLQEIANELNAHYYVLGKDFSYQLNSETWEWQSTNQTIVNLPMPNLYIQNAATVLKVIELLPDKLQTEQSAIIEGIKKAELAGRRHVFAEGQIGKGCNSVTTIFDVAHNPASAELLAEFLKDYQKKGDIHAVFSIFEDKDIEGTVKPLQDIVSHWHIAKLPYSRGANTETISNVLATLNIQSINQYSTIEMAYHEACHQAKKNDTVVVFGSFCTVEPILKTTMFRKINTSL